MDTQKLGSSAPTMGLSCLAISGDYGRVLLDSLQLSAEVASAKLSKYCGNLI
jgi:hypothetical protein